MGGFTFELPEVVSLNKFYAGMHWTKRKALADLYHLSIMALKAHIDKPSTFPINIEYIFHLKRKMDVSNTSAMAKMIEDGFVKAKIIPDDTNEYVSSMILKAGDCKSNKVEVRFIYDGL